jgi:Domain of unknown function (DUF4189)
MNNDTISRTRIAAAATLAAGAVLAGALGSAAPANAAPDLHIGLAYSFQSGIPGIAVRGDKEQSRIDSLSICQDTGGNHCVWFGTFTNTCAAMAIEGELEWNTATGSTRKDAEDQALAQNPGSHIAVSGCTAGSPRKPLNRVPLGPLTQSESPYKPLNPVPQETLTQG